jgi:DNA polymerase III delta subunit
VNIESLAKSLEPWMHVSTWHTAHPLDNERFHKALSNAIREHGCQISYDQFKEAMEYLFEKHYPDMKLENFESEIEQYAGNAENIASYIYDTQ